MHKIITKTFALIAIAGVAMTTASCSLFKRTEEDIKADDAKYKNIVEEKAADYGIDPEGVTVEEGGEYFRVPIDPVTDVANIDDYIVLQRRWLRLAYNEFGRRYFVGFFDRNNPDIMYGGFSDQDGGYPSEWYWNDMDVVRNYILRLRSFTDATNKKPEMTPEEFAERTGIDSDCALALWDWYHATYYANSRVIPDKSEHDVTFIPGDNIQHYEEFTIGDDDCPIEPGTYSVDMTGDWGVITVVDDDGNLKYRIDADYPDGKTDELYSYLPLPTVMELDDGDIIYTTNCISTFDLHDEEDEVRELFEYNPHPYSYLIAKEVPQDYWDSLYNLSDAIRIGADTFDCSSQAAYDWCMEDGVLANLIPAACMKISGTSNDGTTPYENGVGRIYYNMSVDDFVAREAEFERLVEEVLNEYLETDDDDFEKCLKLYDYMESNYTYNYDLDSEAPVYDGFVYTCLMNHTGQCIDLGCLYAYLLCEVGVEAIAVGSFEGMDHLWTYAVVNGEGYHIDPTWSLKAERYTDSLYLDYFMMTDEQRAASGCSVDDLTVQLLPQFWVNKSSLSIPADDERFDFGEYSSFKELDEENKIIYYYDTDGNERSLSYGS